MARKNTNILTLTRLAAASLFVFLAASVPAGEETPAPVTPPAPAATETPATPPAPVNPAEAAAAPAAAVVEAPAPEEPPILNRLTGIDADYPIHADFTLKYRVRWTHDTSDQDLYQYLNLMLGDPRSNLVTAYAALRVSEDIDGRSGVTGFYTFDSLNDTYKQPTNAQLYAAYVQVNHMGLIDLFRVGRQTLSDMPITLQFDGGRLETWRFDDLKRLQLGVFGGLPVHLYEDNHYGDSLYGAYAKCEPWQGARLQADWTHLEDRTLLADSVNDLYGIGLWQRILNDFQFYGRYNRLNTVGRDVEARVIYNSSAWDLNVSASWYALTQKQNALSIDIDPFTQVLLTQFPYWEARLTIDKALGEKFDFLAGGVMRQLFDSNDIGPNNREFNSAYATLSSTNFPIDGLEADVTWSAYDAREFESTNQTVSGDIGYRVRREIGEHRYQDLAMVQVGTSYSLYKYDFFLSQEVQRTRTWYAKVWWKPYAWLRWDARFSHESSDFGDYSDFSSSLRLQF
ncbi:MAG TPA: hypothetical protein VL860_03380 [Planctomycetota bacterium]|nr:hypothetical protein [Planctomycetota bacterium]